MILPTKHVSARQSLLGNGALILRHLQQPQTVTHLWGQVKEERQVMNFNRFILALDLLHAIDAVELDDGLIVRSGQ